MRKNVKPFIEKLKEYQEEVNAELKAFFAKQSEKSRLIDASSLQMIKALEEFTLRGGKRTRASLTFYGYKCFSKKNAGKNIVQVSMANELIQTGLLIHDDIIDRDDLRRGKSTFHKVYEKIGEETYFRSNDPEKKHFGMAMAILGGDVALSLANIILCEVDFANKPEAILALNEVVCNTTFGQVIDVCIGYDPTLSLENALKICTLKTAYYSVEKPLVLGAIIAGATKAQIKTIGEFSIPLGIAFAIQDDMLDLFGEEKKLGKTVGSDMREGKKTFILIKTLEASTLSERKFIQSILGKKDITTKEIEKIKSIMVKTGALKYCTEYSQNLINEAKKIIRKQKYYAEGEDFLLGMADYLLNRKY